MKNLFEYKEFINREELNEGLIDWLKNMFKKAEANMQKVKGSKEIEKIYQDSLVEIDKQIAAQTKIRIQLKNAGADAKEVEGGETGTTAKKEGYSFLNEAEEGIPTAAAADAPSAEETTDAQKDGEKKANVKDLNAKLKNIQAIIKKNKDIALKKMNLVLTKYDNNADLKIVIQIKQDQYELDLLEAEAKFLEGSEEPAAKTQLKKVQAEIKNLSQKRADDASKLGKGEEAEIEVGDKKFKVNFPYRSNGRPMTIVDKIEGNDNSVKAKWIFGKNAEKEQEFNIDNIELDFKPDPEKEYYYYNDDKKMLKVKPVSDKVDDKGLVEVGIVGGEEGKTFKVKSGRLSDVSEELKEKRNFKYLKRYEIR